MKFIFSKSNDPYKNLTIEEILLKDPDIKDDIVYIYINDNTIVMGRNQNALEEVDINFVKENNINLVRRVSGGGSVYHDLGNVNFSFITNKQPHSYSKFLEPIIEFLRSLGLDANFKGKNDIEVNGFKVSGNAQYLYKDRMFHHGTLLFDTNLSVLGKALTPHPLKLQSKGIKSAKARVSNINDLLDKKITVKEFTDALQNFFLSKGATLMSLEGYKEKEVEELYNQRKSKDWIFGKNPQFDIKLEAKFDSGLVIFKIHVEENKIKDIKIEGDFLSCNNFEDIFKYFIDQDFDKVSLSKVIDSIKNFNEYFGKISKEEIKTLFKDL